MLAQQQERAECVAAFVKEVFENSKAGGKCKSLREFAATLNVRHQSVSLWLKGGAVPDAESRKALANAAGISTDEINQIFLGQVTLKDLMEENKPLPIRTVTRSLPQYGFQELIYLQNKITEEISLRGAKIESVLDVQSSAETKRKTNPGMYGEYVNLNSKQLQRLRNLVIATAVSRGWINKSSALDIIGAMLECESRYLELGVDLELYRQVGHINASGFTRSLMEPLRRTLLKVLRWEGDAPTVSRQTTYRDLDELLRDLANGTNAVSQH